MKSEKMIEQLELYGNAITGFFVVQSIGFAYTLGTSQTFKCFAFLERSLNISLTAHFFISSLASCFALHFISRSIQRLSADNADLVKQVHKGKAAAVVAFASIPFFILLFYGLNPSESLAKCLAGGIK